MRKYLDKWTVGLLVFVAVIASVNIPDKTWAGIIQAIVPQAVPTANKQGNGTKFFLAGSVSGTAATICTDANGNATTSGCSAGGQPGATLFSTTDSTTVTAASATTLIGTVTGSTTIPANTFTAGGVMEFIAQGYYTTPVAARTITIELLIGGSTRISTGAVTVLPSVTNGVWKLHCGVTTRTAGASGSQIANCIFHMAPSSTSVLTPADASMQTSSTWTVDTTGTLVVDLKATWDSTTGSPSITSSNIAAWIPGAPVTSVGGATGAVKSGFQGNGTLIQLSTGSTTTNNCAKFDANGNVVDAGAACSSGSGSYVLIEQHTASTSASLDFTTCLTSTYDTYQIVANELVNASANTQLWLRVSTDGGATYVSSSSYAWGNFRFCATGSASAGSNSDTKIVLAGTGNDFVQTASRGGFSGIFNLFNPLGGAENTKTTYSIGYPSSGACLEVTDGGTAVYSATTAVNAFQLLASSGNINSGTARCYGVAK